MIFIPWIITAVSIAAALWFRKLYIDAKCGLEVAESVNRWYLERCVEIPAASLEIPAESDNILKTKGDL